ncbi:5'-nucleotidase C-terminal domain-containing protein [Bacteroides sp. OttesenSCG-928-J23]|nr:5'-nucleotidase C-terminal domain-containing protein [Bacteroides sp. OttesenSCG-928-J23]
MKQFQPKLFYGVVMICILCLLACNSSYQLTTITGSKTLMDDSWDNVPNIAAQEALKPFSAKVDSIMSPVVGRSSMDMVPKRPGSPLSNLMADVLKEAAEEHFDQPADIGIVNIGGLRNSLNKGDITYGDIFQILPFENSICLVTLTGEVVHELIENIVSVRGEGISNVQIVATKDRKLVSCTVGGQPIDPQKLYKIATLDYLAEGNDQMVAFKKNVKKECRPEATIRLIFLKYVQELTKQGKEVSASTENRIIIADN